MRRGVFVKYRSVALFVLLCSLPSILSYSVILTPLGSKMRSGPSQQTSAPQAPRTCQLGAASGTVQPVLLCTFTPPLVHALRKSQTATTVSAWKTTGKSSLTQSTIIPTSRTACLARRRGRSLSVGHSVYRTYHLHGVSFRYE